MNNFNNNSWSTSFVQLHQLHVGANVAGWLSLLAASAALISAPMLKPTASSVALLTAIGSGLGAVASFRGATNSSRTINDYADITSQNMQTNLYTETMNTAAVDVGDRQGAAVAQPKSAQGHKAPTLFDWHRFETHRTEYPHLSIVAGTGAGKSTLAEWLCTLLGGRTIAIAPHWESGDYDGADLIVGAGRRYGSSAEPYEVTEDRKGNPIIIGEVEVDSPDESTTVMQFLNWLTREMDRRYQLDSLGKRVSGEALNIIFDEIPSYSGLPGYKDCMRVLIREARKVNIRLILMLQGKEVVAFGFQGEGQLRENLTQILVGKFALKEAAMNARTAKGSEVDRWERIYELLEGCERPALVEDEPAAIPTVSKAEVLDSEPLPMDEDLRQSLIAAIFTVAEKQGEPIHPSDVGRYDRRARVKGVNAPIIAGIFDDLEADGQGIIDERGRFTVSNQIGTSSDS